MKIPGQLSAKINSCRVNGGGILLRVIIRSCVVAAVECFLVPHLPWPWDAGVAQLVFLRKTSCRNHLCFHALFAIDHVYESLFAASRSRSQQVCLSRHETVSGNTDQIEQEREVSGNTWQY